jgi:hypothetical protein
MCSGKCNSQDLVLGEEHTDKDIKRPQKSRETAPLSTVYVSNSIDLYHFS